MHKVVGWGRSFQYDLRRWFHHGLFGNGEDRLDRWFRRRWFLNHRFRSLSLHEIFGQIADKWFRGFGWSVEEVIAEKVTLLDFLNGWGRGCRWSGCCEER